MNMVKQNTKMQCNIYACQPESYVKSKVVELSYHLQIMLV